MTRYATFRFYEELNDFLPPARRKRPFELRLNGPASVKDLIESAGVPHTEIDLILVNGHSVDFSYAVQPGDYISVYPVFESFDVSSLTRLRPEPLRQVRFVLDAHLGKLARHLRLLGFDALYSNAASDRELARISASGDRRILLTRDHGLLKRKAITHGYFVRETDPVKQAREILERFDLYAEVRPFLRCMDCNGLIQSVDREAVSGRVPPGVLAEFDRFSTCTGCARVYWQGSHYLRMNRVIEMLLRGQPGQHDEGGSNS